MELRQKTNNKQLIKDIRKLLEKVRKFRNQLAHSPLDTSREATTVIRNSNNSDDISFQILEYKKGKINKHIINKEKIKLEITNMNKAYYKLLQLWALLKNDIEHARACETLATMSDEETHAVIEKLGLSEE